MQVIVPVRNAGAGWIELPRSTSTYRVVDGAGREIASGLFTAALPEVIGPGEIGYLIETVSSAFVVGRGERAVQADIKAVATERPIARLSVDALKASTAPDGGLRVTGRVRNVGSSATGWVMAGAIVLDRTGRPLGAAYDPGRIGTIQPGASATFDTSYPGAPPMTANAAKLVGVVYEALDDPTG